MNGKSPLVAELMDVGPGIQNDTQHPTDLVCLLFGGLRLGCCSVPFLCTLLFDLLNCFLGRPLGLRGT